MKVKSESEVVQLCQTLSDPMDCSPAGSSVHGIFQARVLEWGAIAFSVCMYLETPNNRLLLILCCFQGDASGKEPADNAGDLRDVGLIPGLRKSPGGEHGNPLQCSCLDNPIDKEAWWTTVHRTTESD